MSCSMKPLVYMATLTTNADYDGGTPETGVFNPVSKLLPTAEFTSLRCTFEVLSRSSSNLQVCAGGRETNDGKTWIQYFNLAALGIPGVDWTSDLGWQYYPFIHPTALSSRYFQMGFYARLAATSASRGVAVVRFRLDFKSSLTPQEGV